MLILGSSRSSRTWWRRENGLYQVSCLALLSFYSLMIIQVTRRSLETSTSCDCLHRNTCQPSEPDSSVNCHILFSPWVWYLPIFCKIQSTCIVCGASRLSTISLCHLSLVQFVNQDVSKPLLVAVGSLYSNLMSMVSGNAHSQLNG